MSFPMSQEGKNANVYLVDATKRHMLGSRHVLPDGRVFRYAQVSPYSALTIGRAVGCIARSANLAKDGLVAGTAGRTTAEWDNGARTFIVATTSSATSGLHIEANNYDDGYLWINDEAGEGQLMQIKSHGVSTSLGTTAVTITMYDEELLTIALTTASQWGLVENMYKDVVIHTGAAAGGIALGVTTRAVLAGKYFWLQTWGPCPVMRGPESLVVGEQVAVGNTAGTTAPGSAYPQDTTDGSSDFMLPRLGYSIVDATGDLEFALVFLTCAP